MKKLLLFVLILASAYHVQARVVRVESSARADVLEGKASGEAGAYEKLAGKIYFAVRPDTVANKLVGDLDKAPRHEKVRLLLDCRGTFGQSNSLGESGISVPGEAMRGGFLP